MTQDWPRVKAFVTSVVRDFLEQNGFLRSLSSASPSAKRRLVFDAVSSNGHSTLVKKLKQEGSPLKQVSAQSSVATVCSGDQSSLSLSIALTGRLGVVPQADRNVVSYRDPTTKKVFKLDRHTGTSLAIGPPERSADDEQASGSIPSWLREVLEVSCLTAPELLLLPSGLTVTDCRASALGQSYVLSLGSVVSSWR